MANTRTTPELVNARVEIERMCQTGTIHNDDQKVDGPYSALVADLREQINTLESLITAITTTEGNPEPEAA